MQLGIKVIKWYRGPPVGKHIRQLKLSDDYSAITWQSKGAKRKLTLSEIDEVVKGLSNFSKDVKNPTQLDMSFTVHVNAGKDLEVYANAAVKERDRHPKNFGVLLFSVDTGHHLNKDQLSSPT